MERYIPGIYLLYDISSRKVYIPGIYLTYDLPFHMTGILPGIYPTYDRLGHMSGIYQVYTMIINFQGIPDETKRNLSTD
jgi:hypothetical protein